MAVEPVYESGYARSSWTFFQRNDNGTGQFLRLLDCRLEQNGEISYKWVCPDKIPNRWEREKWSDPDNPVTLYRSELVERMTDADSDFILLQWQPNSDKPERPWVRLDNGFVHNERVLYEVIDCPDAANEQDLRDRIGKGIPYRGRPTKQVLILFRSRGEVQFDAVLIARNDLIFEKGILKLADNAPCSVPLVVLDRQDLQWIPKRGSNDPDRAIYIKPALPSFAGKVAIRPMSDYINDYLRWFMENGRTLHSTDGDGSNIDAAGLLQRALRYPGDLEDYLGMPPDCDELERLRKALGRTINPRKSEMSSLILDIFEHDSAVMGRLQQRTERVVEEKIAARKMELESSIRDLEDKARQRSETNERLQSMQTEILAKNDRLEQDYAVQKQELEQIQNEREHVLRRLDDDVALKLGLRAAFSVATSGRGNDGLPVPRACGKHVAVTMVDTFADALEENLRALGITAADRSMSTADNNHTGCRLLARQLCAALSATTVLAVDSTYAVAVSNAMAYAVNGRPAVHTGVPVDWSDTVALDRLLEECDSPVLMLDHVLDSVNEGVMFALCRQQSKTVVVLPIGSYANLALIAPEVWERVLYLSADGLVQLPARSLDGLCQSKKRWDMTLPNTQAAMGRIKELGNVMKGAVPAHELTVPASILAQSGKSMEAKRWLASHLALQVAAHQGVKAARQFLTDYVKDVSKPDILDRMQSRHV